MCSKALKTLRLGGKYAMICPMDMCGELCGTERVMARLGALSGRVGFYWHDLTSGETAAWHADAPMLAASLIKLPILVTAFRAMTDGKADEAERFVMHAQDKLPSCGALSYMHDGLEVTLLDLCTLMVILSDNTATNLLLRRLGMGEVSREIERMGLCGTVLRRPLFDAEAAGRGLENQTTAADMGKLLTLLYHEALVSPKASRSMVAILQQQRLQGKMPFCLPRGTVIAHKTGEDDGITHDVGIVYAMRPFVACFCANETDVPATERAIQDTTLWLYEDAQGRHKE